MVRTDSTTVRRRFFAPEVVQTSATDCGPATLKCLLEGFGIPISYGRLREACQTDVDGTSIDTMEEIAAQLGLEAEQTMLPLDHLVLPEARALPAIVVVCLPNGLTHFVVAWRTHGRLVQVMDPADVRDSAALIASAIASKSGSLRNRCAHVGCRAITSSRSRRRRPSCHRRPRSRHRKIHRRSSPRRPSRRHTSRPGPTSSSRGGRRCSRADSTRSTRG